MLALSVPSDAMANEGNIEWADLDGYQLELCWGRDAYHRR